MPGVRFDFENTAGRRLSGVLETGASPPQAYVVFAHCFTCDKRSHAAVRISRALADKGFGVLRFDFTGLGESEGEFGAGLSRTGQTTPSKTYRIHSKIPSIFLYQDICGQFRGTKK